MIQILTYIIKKLPSDTKATASIEYAILLGLIAVGVITMVAFVGDWVSIQWSTLSNELDTAGP